MYNALLLADFFHQFTDISKGGRSKSQGHICQTSCTLRTLNTLDFTNMELHGTFL